MKISPGMMSNDNKSLASIARTTRGVGVEHLRDALEGRGSMSNVHLPGSGAYSFSTEGDHHRPSIQGGTKDVNLARLAVASAHNKNRKPLLNKPGDVADVLNKLGIGQQKPDKMLHTPFSGGQKQQDNACVVVTIFTYIKQLIYRFPDAVSSPLRIAHNTFVPHSFQSAFLVPVIFSITLHACLIGLMHSLSHLIFARIHCQKALLSVHAKFRPLHEANWKDTN